MIQQRFDGLEADQTEKTSDDYYTPRWIFDALGVTFDLDVCAPPGGPLHVPCHAYYTKADDGLAQQWTGTVWMNPPYSKPTPWVERWRRHADGIALIPFAKARWFAQLWADPRVRMSAMEHNFTFIGGPIMFPVCLAAIGEPSITALTRLGRIIR